jgi:hypothetical protein
MPEGVEFETTIWISGLLWRGKAYQYVAHSDSHPHTPRCRMKTRIVAGGASRELRSGGCR